MDKKKTIKIIYSSLFLFIIIFPMVFMLLNTILEKPALNVFLHGKPLKGYTDTLKKIELKGSSFFNRKYQDYAEKYLDENLAFREYYIRTNNQINWSIFNLSKNVLAKNKNIVEKAYIVVECGLDKQSDFRFAENYAKLEKYVSSLKSVQEKLKNNNIFFLFYITPSKAAEFYDDLPLKYRLSKPEGYLPPYYYLKDLLEKYGVNYIDTKEYLFPDGEAPDFYSTGIHFSRPLEQKMSKAIIERLEDMSGKKFPEIELGELKRSETPFWRDADIHALENIFTSPQGPYFEYEAKILNEELDFPKILLQGGSFAQGLNHDYLDYYKVGTYINYDRWYKKKQNPVVSIESYRDINLEEFLNDSEFVIIEMNEERVFKYSDGFAEYLDSFLDSYKKDIVLNNEVEYYDLGKIVNFSSDDSRNYIRRGFSQTEKWGTWTEGNEAVLRFNIREKTDLRFRMKCSVYDGPQRVKFFANNILIEEFVWDKTEEREFIIPLECLGNTGKLNIRFVLPDAHSPKSAGESADSRALGLGFYTVVLDKI